MDGAYVVGMTVGGFCPIGARGRAFAVGRILHVARPARLGPKATLIAALAGSTDRHSLRRPSESAEESAIAYWQAHSEREIDNAEQNDYQDGLLVVSQQAHASDAA